MSYEVFIEPEVHHARTRLPGQVRQVMRRSISELASDPRPSRSEALDVSELDVPAGIEVRRFRLDPWRLLYAVNDEEHWVWVLALRRRPPYAYEDLAELVSKLSGRS